MLIKRDICILPNKQTNNTNLAAQYTKQFAKNIKTKQQVSVFALIFCRGRFALLAEAE